MLSMELIFLSAILLLTGQAYALLIDPVNTDIAMYGDETSQNGIDTVLNGAFDPDLVELYKNDVGDGESGSLMDSYDAVFLNTPNDPEEANIYYVSGDIVGPTAYLLVKDGNQSPAWYLFNLTALGWNGTELLELKKFWPNRGAISHVTLYGESVPVPEPATMMLLGSGLLGLAVVGRKKFLKK